MANNAPTDVKTLPFTGDEYLDSLRDDREIWIYGERIKDVTAHPAFRNPSRMIARLYDALHHPDKQAVLTTQTDTGSGGYTHPFYRIPHTVDDLIASRDAIAKWARMTYGWMGRTPDYKASFLATLGGAPEFYAPYQQNALNWYRHAQEKCLFLSHAIVNPPVDRSLPPDQVADVYTHVVEETDAGLVISGAKVVATGAAMAHHNFVMQLSEQSFKDKRFALGLIVPMNTPGVKLICRPSYAMAAEVMGSPFDYPLSSRFDENDSILIFDKALVPWENVLIYGDVKKLEDFHAMSGFAPRFMLHGCTRLAVKLDFISGLLLKAVEATGSKDFRGVQVNVGEVLAWRSMFWGLADAMVHNPDVWEQGGVKPNHEYGLSFRVFGTMAVPRVKDIIESVVASGLIYINSHAVDFQTAELRPYLDKYLRGSNGMPAEERIKLMKLLWDAIGSEFGGRHELYERNYSGNHELIRLDVLDTAKRIGSADACKALAEQCMAEYDLNGWVADDLINANDISLFTRR